MERWGIETFFSISVTTAEYTPGIAEKLFVWPNFIDSDICHDYGQLKVVPVLFNGSMISLYPWRQKVYKKVSERYPAMTFPHFGYENHSPLMIHGEQYARTINTAWFVPSCGTVAKEIVRKHFEIPGCKSCLITERTPSLDAAGFVDMRNCVFADENDVLDKMNYLFKNEDELEQIITAGYDLVHSKHTLRQRDQIFQWFELYRQLKPNQKIVQAGPFELLRIVEVASGISNKHIISGGPCAVLLRRADEKLWVGHYDQAEALYLECLAFIGWMSEPKLKLTVLNLFQGKPDLALKWISEPIENTLGSYNYLDPDPIEWAYFIIALLCKGDIHEAIIRANQFPSLCHPELDRIRWVVHFLQNEHQKHALSDSLLLRPRHSIHQLPQSGFVDWVKKLCLMLTACDQANIAEMLTDLIFSTKDLSVKTNKNIQGLGRANIFILTLRMRFTGKLNDLFEVCHVPNRRTGLPSISAVDYLIRLSKWAGLDSIKRFILRHWS
jgi:hypothetical protein